MHVCKIFFIFLFIQNLASGYRNRISNPIQWKSNRRFELLHAVKKPSNFDINSPNIGIGVGVLGILGILANRLSVSIDYISDVQSRVDLLGIIGCAAVVLNAVSEQEIEIKERDAVPLVGYALKDPVVEDSLDNQSKSILLWAIETLMNTTEITSVHIIDSDRVIGRGGVIGREDNMSKSTLEIQGMPILMNAIMKSEELYLPDLQILPGKIEFSYLPINAQAVLIIPFENKAIVTATNKAKSLKIVDILRTRSVAEVIRQLSKSRVESEVKPDTLIN